MLVALFVFSGVTKLIDITGTAGRIQAKGLPAPSVLAVAAAVVEITGGLMVIHLVRWQGSQSEQRDRTWRGEG